MDEERSAAEKRIGRPSTKTPEAVEEICDRLASGEPLAEICRDDHMPGLRTVYHWMEDDKDVSAFIARARDAGFDVIAAGCLPIADDGRNDWMARNDEGNAGYQANGEHIQRSRLRVDTRLKLLAKWSPKRYGERTAHELSGPDGAPIEINNARERNLALVEEVARRIAGETPEVAASLDTAKNDPTGGE